MDIVAAIFSLLVMVAFLKVWQPAEVMPVSGELGRVDQTPLGDGRA